MPEPLALPAKMRSPGRRTGRCFDGGSVGAFVAVTAAPWELFVECVCRGCRAGAMARDVGSTSRASAVGRGQPAVMASMAPWACSRRVSEIGALPAFSAAVCWPSSLTTYSMNALTLFAVSWSSYWMHPMW